MGSATIPPHVAAAMREAFACDAHRVRHDCRDDGRECLVSFCCDASDHMECSACLALVYDAACVAMREGGWERAAPKVVLCELGDTGAAYACELERAAEAELCRRAEAGE